MMGRDDGEVRDVLCKADRGKENKYKNKFADAKKINNT